MAETEYIFVETKKDIIMKSNIASADRIIRVLIFVGVLVLYLLDIITGTLGYTLLGISAVLLITSFINFCPLYKLFGISTRKN